MYLFQLLFIYSRHVSHVIYLTLSLSLSVSFHKNIPRRRSEVF